MAFSSSIVSGVNTYATSIVFLSRTQREDKGERDNKECLPVYVPSPYKHIPLEYPCNQDCPV